MVLSFVRANPVSLLKGWFKLLLLTNWNAKSHRSVSVNLNSRDSIDLICATSIPSSSSVRTHFAVQGHFWSNLSLDFPALIFFTRSSRVHYMCVTLKDIPICLSALNLWLKSYLTPTFAAYLTFAHNNMFVACLRSPSLRRKKWNKRSQYLHLKSIRVIQDSRNYPVCLCACTMFEFVILLFTLIAIRNHHKQQKKTTKYDST